MILKFVSPLLHDADGGQRSGVTERAEGAAEHVLRKLSDQVNVFAAAKARVEAFQHFAEPRCSLAAGNAPAAGLVRVKVHDPARHVDHAGVFIHNNHAAGAKHRTGFGDGVVVHRKIDFVRGENRAGAAAGNYGFELLAVGNASRDFVEKLLHVHAERNFVDAGLVDVAGDAEQASATVFRGAAVGVSFAAFVDDRRHGAECFHVIDNRGAAVQADDSREGRLDPRVAAFTFERFHEGGLFATFVGARAGVNQQIVIEARAKYIFA